MSDLLLTLRDSCNENRREILKAAAAFLAIKIAYDGPINWWDYACVQAQLWKIQLSNMFTAAGPSASLSSIVGANVALWQLLRIERVHLLEKRKLLRNNMDPFGRLDPNLPHVESLAKRAAEKKKLGMKYVWVWFVCVTDAASSGKNGINSTRGAKTDSFSLHCCSIQKDTFLISCFVQMNY